MSMAGKKHSVKTRALMRAKKLGKPRTQETIAHLRAVAKERYTPEYITAIKARFVKYGHPRTGTKHTAESRAKMTAAHKKRWQKRREAEHEQGESGNGK